MSDGRTVKALEHLQPYLDREQESVMKELARLIADNKLTAELALQKCHELNALHTLPKKVLRGVSGSREHRA